MKWEQLISARDRLHLSQLEAAECLNIGVTTYQRWEQGKMRPQPHNMRCLRETFGHLLRENGIDVSEYDEIFPPMTRQHESQSAPMQRNESSAVLVVSVHPPESLVRDAFAQTFIASHMTTRLLALAFFDHPTCDEKRRDISQAIKECDVMNDTGDNYRISRREAVYALVALPMTTLGLTLPGRTLQPSQYGAAVAQCAASLEACWELGKDDDAHNLAFAFQSAASYQVVLETIARHASQYRQDALDLATRYALIKAVLDKHCVGPISAIRNAQKSVDLSQETGDVSLQLSAYSKLAWTYFYNKRYDPALQTALQAQALLEAYNKSQKHAPLPQGLQGGTYSTLALMQAKKRQSPDLALGRATGADPGNEIHAFMEFTRNDVPYEAGLTLCLWGDQARAMHELEKIVDPVSLKAKEWNERKRSGVIKTMALSSLKNRDMEQAIHFWTAAMEGAKAFQSELRFNEAIDLYDLMEIVWPGEPRITELHDLTQHW